MNLEHESHIVWLHPPTRYAYLRHGVFDCSYRAKFPLKQLDPGKYTDGGPKSHIVAYAVLHPDARRNWCSGFSRRYWWVKEYDRWHGHGTHRGTYYNTGGPCEAVQVWSVQAGVPAVSGWINGLPECQTIVTAG